MFVHAHSRPGIRPGELKSYCPKKLLKFLPYLCNINTEVPFLSPFVVVCVGLFFFFFFFFFFCLSILFSEGWTPLTKIPGSASGKFRNFAYEMTFFMKILIEVAARIGNNEMLSYGMKFY